MSDPKSDHDKITDQEAVESLKAAEDGVVIDAKPEKAPAQATGKSAFASRTKVIGMLVVLLVVIGAIAAALYPLWRDRAANLMVENGIPISVPEVPDNGFYNTVSDVIAFLRGGAAGEPVAETAEPAPEPEPDPLTVLTERVAALEVRFAALAKEIEAARSTADGAADAATAAEGALATLTAELDAVPEVVRDDLAALSRRIDGLQDTMAAAASRPAAAAEGATGSASSVNEALLGTIGALRERIVALEARDQVGSADLDVVASRIETAESGAQERIAGLESELDAVRQLAEKRAPERERAGLLLLAVGQLEAATGGSGTYGTQLDAVKDLATGNDPDISGAIDVLTRHSGGIESVAALSGRFEDLAKAVTQAKIAGTDEGLVGKTLNTIASLVTVRRTDVAEGPGIDAILVRAETGLDEGDLAAAVSALKELSGPPAERAADWLAVAEARLAVDAAVAALRAAALALVAKAG